jgi:hypothetical protein
MNPPLDSGDERSLSRRDALQWMLAAGLAAALPTSALGEPTLASAAPVTGKPYGMDAVLNKSYKPGDLWPLTLSGEQRTVASALADVVIPADEKSPAASAVGVPEFIDEWVSAPYPDQQADRTKVLALLAYVEKEAVNRFGKSFAGASSDQQIAIVDEIAYAPRAAERLKATAANFSAFRNLVLGGFYSTPQGMADVGYLGNKPMTRWDGPPKEVLVKLGLA